MKKSILFALIFVLALSTSIKAQYSVYPEKYWVQFKDKQGTPYSLEKPEEFLSLRALTRRTKYNIEITERDLPVNPGYVKAIREKGINVLYASKWLNGVIIETTDTTTLQSLEELDFVVEYTPDTADGTKKTSQQNTEQANDTSNTQNFELDETDLEYGMSINQIKMMNGHLLHNMGFKGEGMQIAVLDAGFYRVDSLPAFDSLWANDQILGTKDFVRGGEVSFNTSQHGMQVLSTMGGYLPGKLVGTAPKANYWLLRSEDASSEYIIEEFNWIRAAEYADSVGADVINTSLGYSDFNDKSQSHRYEDLDGNTTPISRAADWAAKRGMLVVVSAGNEGYSSWSYITAPADADSIITVGAVSASGEYAYFSSVGYTPDGRVKPDVVAQGLWSVVQGTSGNASVSNGTSFSAPILCGAVTCLWQSHPDLSNMDIKKALIASSHQYTNPDSLLGYGIPDFGKAYLYLKEMTEKDSTQGNKLKVFPNPFNNHLNLQMNLTDAEEISVKISSLKGDVVYNEEFNLKNQEFSSVMIDKLDNLQQGIYVVKVISTDKTLEQKIVKL